MYWRHHHIKTICVCFRFQCGDGWVQEHLLHSLGCRWSGQDQTSVETLLPEHTGTELRPECTALSSRWTPWLLTSLCFCAGSHLCRGQQWQRESCWVCWGTLKDGKLLSGCGAAPQNGGTASVIAVTTSRNALGETWLSFKCSFFFLHANQVTWPCRSITSSVTWFCLQIQEDELKEAVILVFANKQDLPNAMGVSELTDKLGLHNLRSRTVRKHTHTHCQSAGCLRNPRAGLSVTGGTPSFMLDEEFSTWGSFHLLWPHCLSLCLLSGMSRPHVPLRVLVCMRGWTGCPMSWQNVRPPDRKQLTDYITWIHRVQNDEEECFKGLFLFFLNYKCICRRKWCHGLWGHFDFPISPFCSSCSC